MAETYDFDAGRKKRHQEREAEFGEKPFKFAGEIFYVRANTGYEAIKRVAALSESSSGEETFEAIERSVFSMIDPRDDAIERFRRVVANDDDPVTFEDLVELQNWLIQEQTGRPPTQEQSSSPTPPTATTNLTVLSSTEPDAVSMS